MHELVCVCLCCSPAINSNQRCRCGGYATVMVGSLSRCEDVPLVPPAIKVVSQSLTYFGVQEAVQQRYDETLGAQQGSSRDRKDVAADALVRSVDYDEVGDAEQRNKYQQCLGCLTVLPCFHRVRRAELGDEDPHYP